MNDKKSFLISFVVLNPFYITFINVISLPLQEPLLLS